MSGPFFAQAKRGGWQQGKQGISPACAVHQGPALHHALDFSCFPCASPELDGWCAISQGRTGIHCVPPWNTLYIHFICCIWLFEHIYTCCLNIYINRIMEELRLVGIFGNRLVRTSAQAGPPKAGCPGPCPVGFCLSPRMEAPQPLWATRSTV